MNKQAILLPVIFLLMTANLFAQKAKPAPAPPPASDNIFDEDDKEKAKEPAKDSSKMEDYTEFLRGYGIDWKSLNTTDKTVTIGSQTWNTENLNVSTFRNGDPIIEAKTESDWQVAYAEKKPAWSYYNNDAANGAKYGRLYNFYAVTDPRGLAPAGWHIPTKEEWDKMIASLPTDAETIRKMRGTGTGDYGFVQGGYRTEWDFKGIDVIGQWWSTTKKTIYGAYGSSITTGCIVYSLSKSYDKFTSNPYSTDGFSVRCVKD